MFDSIHNFICIDICVFLPHKHEPTNGEYQLCMPVRERDENLGIQRKEVPARKIYDARRKARVSNENQLYVLMLKVETENKLSINVLRSIKMFMYFTSCSLWRQIKCVFMCALTRFFSRSIEKNDIWLCAYKQPDFVLVLTGFVTPSDSDVWQVGTHRN